jgi:UDP-N-acetylmuramyl pentapeptide synthase
MLPLFERGGSRQFARLPSQARFLGGSDIQASSCVTDVSDCQPGDLFVAIADTDRDGHEDVAEAGERRRCRSAG